MLNKLKFMKKDTVKVQLAVDLKNRLGQSLKLFNTVYLLMVEVCLLWAHLQHVGCKMILIGGRG